MDKTRKEQLKLFLSQYKWIVLPGIILFVFFIIIIFILLANAFTPQDENQSLTPTPIPTIPISNQTPTLTVDENTSEVHGNIVLYENSPRLEKKETLPDGAIQYTLTSDVPNRPDIALVTGPEQIDVFSRSVSNPAELPLLASYIEVFGQPERIIQGSRFYGQNASWYLYPQDGMAFVVRNGQVLELHIFEQMSLQQYLQLYGDDITQNSPSPAP